MFLLLSCLLIANHYDVISVLTPNQQENDLFGRSVALCSSLTKIVVGASWRNHNKNANIRSGALFVYDFDFTLQNWTQTQEIYPDMQFSDNITVLNLGDTVEFSRDCNTIIAGAPYTNIKTSKGEINEAGSVVIFQKGENENNYRQIHVGIPTDPIAGGGFGRTLAISPDGNFYAAANYNKFGESKLSFEGQVEVHMNIYENNQLQWARYILQPPSHILDGNRYRFGNKIQFLDASTLIVSADDIKDDSKKGIYIYKKKFNTTSNEVFWQLVHEGINPIHDSYNNIGEAFSMPSTNQDLIALLGTNQTNSGVIFMQKNDTTDLWEKLYTIDLPQNSTASQLSFCREDKFAISGKMNSKSCLFIYSKSRHEPHKPFRLYDTIFMPEKDQNSELNLNYLSSFAWEKDRCFRFAVGAMSKTKINNEHIAYKFGRTYVYQSNDFGYRHFMTHYELMPILGVAFFSILLLIIIGSVIAFYVIKYRKRRQRILMNQVTD